MIPLLTLAMLIAQPQPAAPPPGAGSADAATPAPRRTEAPGVATTAGLAWLALVDKGDLAGSWRAAGGLFRSRVPEAEWTSQLSKTRRPLGTVVSRRALGEQPVHDMPGAPAGDYRVLGFTTDFASAKGAFETVVMTQDGGAWRVVGYFIADGSEDGAPDDGRNASPPPSSRR